MDILNAMGLSLGAISQRPKVSGTEIAAVTPANSDVSIAQVAPISGYATASNSPYQMRNAINGLNQSVQNIQRGIEFSFDDESGRSVVKVVDRDTGEVIRQLPTEDALAVSRNIKEFVEARQPAVDSAGQAEEALGFIMQVQV